MHTKWIYVDTKHQQLFLYEGGRVLSTYPVSTAKNGLGEIQGSEKTPRGWHRIEQKIGEGMDINTIFIGRVAMPEPYSLDLDVQHPDRDWIMARILWLKGVEDGKNSGERDGVSVDTYTRYIYIHGFPDRTPIDKPLSRGCVRMRNHDLLVLFEQVNVKTPVYIGDEPPTNTQEYVQ